MSPLRPIARRALAAQSDERLVRLLREGHEPAFEEIVRRYRSPLVAFATAIVSHTRAEDVVQASLEKAHRALLADSREVALKPWLFTIVRNGALNTIRAEPRAEELVAATSTVPGPSELAEQREDLDRLVEAIIALPAAQRDALVKRELEGEGHGEIAAQLGTSATAVRGLIFRARTSLRDALGAVVPLPVLRLLLTEGPTVAGGAAAGGGVSAAVLGGAGAKGGTVIAAAIVALGTGIAVDHGSRSDQRQPGSDIAADVRAVGGGTAAADAAATGPSGALVDGSASGEGAATAGDYNGYDVEPASDFGPGRADDGGSGPGRKAGRAGRRTLPGPAGRMATTRRRTTLQAVAQAVAPPEIKRRAPAVPVAARAARPAAAARAAATPAPARRGWTSRARRERFPRIRRRSSAPWLGGHIDHPGE